jgi:glucose-6-phosphate 1-epimerase
MSGKSLFTRGKAIRGGIPVCFPWFGPHASDSSLPVHGFARISQWSLASVEEEEGLTRLVLSLSDSAETRKLWPYAFKLSLEIAVSARLEMTMRIVNPGKEAFAVSDALHSYFRIKDSARAWVEGVEGLSYVDRVGERATRKQSGPARISGETDRVYLKSKSVRVVDPGFKRVIEIERKAFPDLVLWNPWIAKAKAMADFGDEEYKDMICAEAAAVFENAVRVEPGKAATQRMAISATPLAIQAG